jgi:Vitamin K-dependent gamma-carboxylase
VVFVLSGLCVSLGFHARRVAWVFTAVAAWVALSDRLAAFSVSKLAPIVGLALALSPCGLRFGIDAWRQRRRAPSVRLPTHVASGSARFFQILIPTIYCASGIAKCRGDWLHQPYVLWSHLHGTYQTSVTIALANLLPAFAWTLFQVFTLVLETFAPLWFAWGRTRPFAVLAAASMHAMIGLMFGPVRYFAILMATLIVGSHLSAERLERLAARLRRRLDA